MGENSSECGSFREGRRVHKYSPENVPVFVRIGSTKESYSELERLLYGQWDEAMKEGVFRYDLSDVNTRSIPGQYGFIAQRNPKRFSHRRHPADLHHLKQPFDPSRFNFNKINPREVLFEIQRDMKSAPATSEADDPQESNLLIVNVSPIDYAHVLIVPRPLSCLPQVMTAESLRLCLEITALSSHQGFCMVGNSLLAYASVNHLHYHFLRLNHPLLARTAVGAALAGGCFELEGHPCRGFGFQLVSTAENCAREIFKVVSLLLELGIAHNVGMLRGPSFDGRSEAAADCTVVRTILIPRRPVTGFKKLYESDDGIPLFFAAACELVFGFIPVLDQSKYSTLSEEVILEMLHDVTLPEADFLTLKESIKNLS